MPPSSTPFLALRALSRDYLRVPQSRTALRSRSPQLIRTSRSLPSRCYSSSRPLTDRPLSPAPQNPNFSHKPSSTIRPPKPEYQITFTCTPCSTRSTHRISKQGYHHGSVLISCPECKNRHVISDHLGIFGDRKITIEDLMKERGQLVKRGTLGEEGGDIEFWPDESSKDSGSDAKSQG